MGNMIECCKCGKEFDRSKEYGIRGNADGSIGYICPRCFPSSRGGGSFNNWGGRDAGL